MRLHLGLRMRAMVDRRELAAIRGVDLGRTSAAGWVLGVTVAGITGILAAPLLALSPGQFTDIFFVAATAAVVAGLRSVPIALIAGLGLGIAQNLVTGYVTFTQSIVGLHDYAQLSGDPTAQGLYDEGQAELAREVPEYDTGAWSLYSTGTSSY